MRVLFLGTGSSLGTPMIGCHCPVCRSNDPHDRRLRASVFIEWDGENILIDPGPDFRQQCLTHGITRIDTFLITHPHHDHIGGLDDTRSLFYAMNKQPLQFYAEDFSIDGMHKYYDYLFPANGVSRYHGAPKAHLHTVKAFQSFATKQHHKIVPLRVWHGKNPATGFRLGTLVYLTDVKRVPDETARHIHAGDTLVLGALQKEEHALHFNLAEALAFVRQTGPRQTYLTHIGHRMGKHESLATELPAGISPAYDGMEILI